MSQRLGDPYSGPAQHRVCFWGVVAASVLPAVEPLLARSGSSSSGALEGTLRHADCHRAHRSCTHAPMHHHHHAPTACRHPARHGVAPVLVRAVVAQPRPQQPGGPGGGGGQNGEGRQMRKAPGLPYLGSFCYRDLQARYHEVNRLFKETGARAMETEILGRRVSLRAPRGGPVKHARRAAVLVARPTWEQGRPAACNMVAAASSSCAMHAAGTRAVVRAPP